MWGWIKRVGSAAGIAGAIIGIGSIVEDFAGWRRWADQLATVLYPHGVIIICGLALFTAFNAPKAWWSRLGSNANRISVNVPLKKWFSALGIILWAVAQSARPRSEIEDDRRRRIKAVTGELLLKGELLLDGNLTVDELEFWVGMVDKHLVEYLPEYVDYFKSNVGPEPPLTAARNMRNRLTRLQEIFTRI